MAEDTKTQDIIEEPEETSPVVDEVAEVLAPDDTEEEVVEAAPAEDEAVPEEEAEPEPSKLNAILGDEVPEEHSDAGKTLLGSVTKDELDAELTPVAKELIRAIRIEAAKEVRAIKAQQEQERTSLAQQKAALAKDLRELRRQKAELDRLVTDPEFQKALTPPDGEAPEDPTSPEFVNYQVQKALAERLKTAFTPMAKQAEKSQAEARWDEITDTYPDLKNRESDLHKEVMGLFHADKEAGRQPIGIDRYVALAQGNLARKREQDRQKAMAAKRRESARKIARTSSPNGANAGATEVPREIVRQGGAAVAEYLRNNPSARAAVEKAAGIGSRR